MNTLKALSLIEESGVVLVFPLQNRADPPSLWHLLYPSSHMRWDWDADADPRVARLWHLRAELAASRKVVYAKWLKGRATFFARDVFRAALHALAEVGDARVGLGRDAEGILALLEENSPRSTKELRAASGLSGKAMSSTYDRALKELWARLLIVGAGEVDDGAFPSLAVGATDLLFEDLRAQSVAHNAHAEHRLQAAMKASVAITREMERSRNLVAVRAPHAIGRTPSRY